MPVWWWAWLYQVKNVSQKARASWIEPNRAGNVGWYLTVLNAASENGLSLDTCGREWDRRTCRSARRSATFFEVIEVPRSAWTAWGTAMTSLMNAAARSADSPAATFQPTM